MKAINTLAVLVFGLFVFMAAAGVEVKKVSKYDGFNINHYFVINDVSLFRTYEATK